MWKRYTTSPGCTMQPYRLRIGSSLGKSGDNAPREPGVGTCAASTELTAISRILAGTGIASRKSYASRLMVERTTSDISKGRIIPCLRGHLTRIGV